MDARQFLALRRVGRHGSRTLAILLTGLMLTACSDTTKNLELSLTGSNEDTDKDGKPLSPLDKAAKAYAKDPKSVETALAYADQLKQHDRKGEALTLLQQASQFNPSNRLVLSAYGRLALEQGKISMAKGLLEAADDPSNPDWRVLSARGTVLAKEGKHKESIAFYERARPLSNEHPSVINNLALAHMMSGEPEKAEPYLRQASAADPSNIKIRQNLAIVLSLQGKYSEAKTLASKDLAPDAAAANAELLRTIVRLEEKPGSNPMEGWSANIGRAQPKPSASSVQTSSIRPSL